jgi:asparagine synthase (glutamine-hydrolysing)
MPGIAGIISARYHPENRTELDSMVQCMLHEKFYRSGTFIYEPLGLSVGWVSHAGSFSDCMPAWNEERNICLVFSGEDYQDRSEIDRLRTKGHDFNPRNASYLVHLYEDLGSKFLERINGWFSGLVVDLRENKILLFNDRYGLGRICYYEDEHGFYFSSEAKSLLRILPQLRSLDLKSLGEFFSCGCVLQNRTLFSGVSLLPGSSVWTTFKDQPIRKEVYFQPRLWEEQAPLSSFDYYERLKETWKRILPRYVRENERAALSLTGGVDSRMILAWAPSLPGQLPCYTFGGRYRDCNDVKLGRQLAKICQQPHYTIAVDGEFLSEFPALVEKTVYISEGNLDASGSIDLFVQRRARQIAPIRITGTNGGEMLRRLVAFKPTRFQEDFFDPDMTCFVSAAVSTYAEELKCNRLSFTAFKQAPWYMNSKFVVERSQVTLRMPYFDNELAALSYQTPSAVAEENGPALRLIAEGNPALGRIGTDRALRMEAVAGIERARHLVEELTFKAEYAYDLGMPQWLAGVDHFLAPLHLERLFLGRHKFHHFRVYYRDELRRYLEEILLDPRTLGRSIFRKPVLEEMVRGHAGGYRNYTLEIHKLLAIELMQRQLIEQN